MTNSSIRPIRLAILALVISFFSCSSPVIKDHEQLEKERLSKNRVKVMRLYSVNLGKTEVNLNDKTLMKEFYYDPQGNLKTVYGYINGTRELNKIVRYDDNQNKTLEIWLKVNPYMDYQYYQMRFTYNEKNIQTSWNIHLPDGSFSAKYIYGYDAKDRLISDVYQNTVGDTIAIDSLFYLTDARDPYERRIYEYDDNSILRLHSHIKYQYNGNRLVVSEREYLGSGVDKIIDHFTNTYDENGLLRQRIRWDIDPYLPVEEWIILEWLTYEYVTYKLPVE